MIARIWHGRVPDDKADAYMEYLRATGLKEYAATAGNRGVYVLRRREGGFADYLLLSLWDSWEAIRGFAGTDVERAVYYPEDREFLVETEPTVAHYEVLEAPRPGPRKR
jgi:heme-degrading monooxygenase HmoA